nr:hypothetical protein [Bacillus subtilis]
MISCSHKKINPPSPQPQNWRSDTVGLDSAAVTATAISGGKREQLLAVNISFAEPDMILSHDKDLVKNMMRDLRIPGLIILGDETAKIPNAEIGRDPLWFVDGPDPRANPLVNETFTVIAEEYGITSVLTGGRRFYV